MATKPTDRILDWASGGLTTDPGGSKEAAGWVVSERPPANWWNWILNSFGQWLSWSETSIDDIETKTDLITVTQAIDLDEIPPEGVTRVIGKMHTEGDGVDSTPNILGSWDDVGIAAPQSGDVTTSYVTVRFSQAFASTGYAPRAWGQSINDLYHFMAIQLTTTTMQVYAFEVSDGSLVDPFNNSVEFLLDVKGSL